MKEIHEDFELHLTVDMMEKALQRLKLKHEEKYEFILKGGKSLKYALFALFKSVWATEIIPSSWKQTDIIQKGN